MNKIPARKYTSIDVERQAREMVMNFFAEKFPQLISEWEMLQPAEKWNIMLRLLPYVAPKLSAVTVKTDDKSAVHMLIELMEKGLPE